MAEPDESEAEDSKARERAVQDLEDISILKETTAFNRYYRRRVALELKKLTDLLLYDRGQTKETLWETRQRFLATFDLSKMMEQDEVACMNMINPPKE